MNTMLKVTPEKLIETASEFAGCEQRIRSITQEMVSIVDGFKPVWQGEAATGFSMRFYSLRDDMERLYALIRKHSEDLMSIANEYRQAESESRNMAESLATEAVS